MTQNKPSHVSGDELHNSISVGLIGASNLQSSDTFVVVSLDGAEVRTRMRVSLSVYVYLCLSCVHYMDVRLGAVSNVVWLDVMISQRALPSPAGKNHGCAW